MTYRIQRVNKLIQNELSIFLREEFAELGIFSILEVIVNDDLSFAKVYIDTLKLKVSNENFEKILNNKSGYFRQLLKKRIVSKKIPVLQFIIYPSEPENEAKID